MEQFFTEYGIFLAKFLTFGIAGIAFIGFIAYLATQYEEKPGRLVVRNLNKHYNSLNNAISHAKTGKLVTASDSSDDDASDNTKPKKNVFVLTFEGDVAASGIDNLRKEITAIIQSAKPGDEAVVKLKSPGGLVHSYGFAASQLARFKESGIPLTVCVDHVAASGGYMMACVANKITAAPFAVIGSIGVVAQVPNLHRWLKNRDIDVDVFTAGKYKRTVTILGENTEEGKEKFKEELENTHKLFKDHISQYRPTVDVETLATGETWYGTEALEKKLIDTLGTSDDVLLNFTKNANVYHLRFVPTKTFAKRMGAAAETAVSRLLMRVIALLHNKQIFKW